ncbi:MAG: tRNA adenosine(34) deaminase TadA [Thermodesulfobacteriota bacterium]|nr:tRNA adenosine(34) deaminase TadA [Thermodesulfobacteriota bacterium]
MDPYYFMQEAINEAKNGWIEGEVPVGALLIDNSDRVLAKNHNRCISLNDPTAHAEMLVIRQAATSIKNYRLNGLTMFVTIEPCPMCMGAIINARLEMLIFGAFDQRAGAAGSAYNLANDKRLNHQVKVISGVMENECKGLLQDFFRTRR